MKQVHVECKPDELLVTKLGIHKRQVTHHQGKSRVFHALGRVSGQLAIVDEDPGSARTSYEKSLTFVEEIHGMRFYTDASNNKVCCLGGKLEDWIVRTSKHYKIDLAAFRLPTDPDKLHDIINYRLSDFGGLLDTMLENKNPAMLKLVSFLR
ncbi:MAG TPA: hypothetical protein PKH58_08845 [Paludibacteraceae bacterium]|jgi:hypothetical protein|nr:hypothetical protein [Paludibacteraceae bacterium]